jgi:D-amino-acid oxidase
VVVVGAGVTGLSCAVRLLEAGHRVDVLARDLPLETVSAVAGAFWYPYRALPQERVTAWAREAHGAFAELAGTPGSGVRMLAGTEVHARPAPDPWWVGAVPGLQRVHPPEGYADAWSLVVPVVDMPVHLRWLVHRVEELGGTLTRMTLSALPAPEDGAVVVNCSAMGARLLAGDHTVVPVRGQVVLVEQFGLDHWGLEHSDSQRPTYVVPRAEHVVVGGTALEGEWSRTPDPEAARDILRRAARLVPQVAEATVVRNVVGLRPVRPEVRVERRGDVVHCYGQGGAGVTISWGCAAEVVLLLG